LGVARGVFLPLPGAGARSALDGEAFAAGGAGGGGGGGALGSTGALAAALAGGAGLVAAFAADFWGAFGAGAGGGLGGVAATTGADSAGAAGAGVKRRTAVTAARTCSCPTVFVPAFRAQRIDSAASTSSVPGTPPEAVCNSRAAFRENTRSPSPPFAAMRWWR
jgi:hypothetical protein